MEKIKNHSRKTFSFVQISKEMGNCFFVVSFRNIVVNTEMEIAIFV